MPGSSPRRVHMCMKNWFINICSTYPVFPCSLKNNLWYIISSMWSNICYASRVISRKYLGSVRKGDFSDVEKRKIQSPTYTHVYWQFKEQFQCLLLKDMIPGGCRRRLHKQTEQNSRANALAIVSTFNSSENYLVRVRLCRILLMWVLKYEEATLDSPACYGVSWSVGVVKWRPLAVLWTDHKLHTGFTAFTAVCERVCVSVWERKSVRACVCGVGCCGCRLPVHQRCKN